ncbi:MAG TPA: hypothetical protein PK177_01295 [Burkholderiaceae bacterium]|nr:hypothetical protein [Burkholderiaceae bacterium]
MHVTHAGITQRSDMAHDVAGWRLEPNDLGAVVTHDLRAQGAGNDRRQIDDPNILESAFSDGVSVLFHTDSFKEGAYRSKVPDNIPFI